MQFFLFEQLTGCFMMVNYFMTKSSMNGFTTPSLEKREDGRCAVMKAKAQGSFVGENKHGTPQQIGRVPKLH